MPWLPEFILEWAQILGALAVVAGTIIAIVLIVKYWKS